MCIRDRFYAAYTVVTFGIAHLAGKGRGAWRPAVFVGCCLLCAVPFFYIRFRELFPELPLFFALTGLAYNMLKMCIRDRGNRVEAAASSQPCGSPVFCAFIISPRRASVKTRGAKIPHR